MQLSCSIGTIYDNWWQRIKIPIYLVCLCSSRVVYIYGSYTHCWLCRTYAPIMSFLNKYARKNFNNPMTKFNWLYISALLSSHQTNFKNKTCISCEPSLNWSLVLEFLFEWLILLTELNLIKILDENMNSFFDNFSKFFQVWIKGCVSD